MTGIAITDRSYKGTPQREHLSDCLGCEQRNINRCKEYRIHFVFQILNFRKINGEDFLRIPIILNILTDTMSIH